MDLARKVGEQTTTAFFPNYGPLVTNFNGENLTYVKMNPVPYEPKAMSSVLVQPHPIQLPPNATITVPQSDSGTTNVITIAQQHKCTICNRLFKDENRLMIHMKRHAENKPTSYECTICFKSFTQQGNLKTHYRIHTNEKPYTCDICSKDFRQLSGLKAHQRTHLDFRPYKCNSCTQEFHQSSALRAHVCPVKTEPKPDDSTHRNEMESMAAYKMLQRLPGGERDLSVRKQKTRRPPTQPHHQPHLQNPPFQHPLQLQQQQQQQQPHQNVVRIEYNPEDGNLSFNCDRCSRKFKRKMDLDLHMLIHTNTSQFFQCTMCEKKFVQLGNLKTHIRVHSGEKPYKCSSCPKDFRQLSGLITHERIHTDEKPFQCSACDRRFRQLSGLNSHIVHCKQLLMKL